MLNQQKETRNWHIISTRMEQYLSKIPFQGIKSRHATAIILSYVDYKDKIIDMMQVLSNRSRGFIWSQDGLPGFLQIYDIATFTKDLFGRDTRDELFQLDTWSG